MGGNLGGLYALRRVMFKAAQAASNHNPSLKVYANRLLQAGKPHKVIMTAVAQNSTHLQVPDAENGKMGALHPVTDTVVSWFRAPQFSAELSDRRALSNFVAQGLALSSSELLIANYYSVSYEST